MVAIRVVGGALAGGIITACVCLASLIYKMPGLSVKSIAGLAGGIIAGLVTYDLREAVIAGLLASVISTAITATVLALPSLLGIIREPTLANAFAWTAIQRALYDFIFIFIICLVGSIATGLIKEA